MKPKLSKSDIALRFEFVLHGRDGRGMSCDGYRLTDGRLLLEASNGDLLPISPLTREIIQLQGLRVCDAANVVLFDFQRSSGRGGGNL